MARLDMDQDLFSPIRLDSSFADSSNNSGGSSANLELTSSFTNTPESEHNFLGLQSSEQIFEKASNSDSFVQKIKLKESEISNPDSKASSQNSSHSTKSVDSKTQNVHKQYSNYKRESKENSKTLKDKAVVSKLKGVVTEETAKTLDSHGQNNLKSKKPPRPTSLLLNNKQIESNTLKANKENNKDVKKSSSSKYISTKETCKESSADSFEKRCHVSKSSVNSIKNIKAMKAECLSAEQADSRQKVPRTGFEKVEPEVLDQQLNPSRSIPNMPPQSQYEVSVETMVRDYISFECDKIRQNMYTQQMYFYRQLNKIKEEMKQKHAMTTERLHRVTEKLMNINMSNENLGPS